MPSAAPARSGRTVPSLHLPRARGRAERAPGPHASLAAVRFNARGAGRGSRSLLETLKLASPLPNISLAHGGQDEGMLETPAMEHRGRHVDDLGTVAPAFGSQRRCEVARPGYPGSRGMGYHTLGTETRWWPEVEEAQNTTHAIIDALTPCVPGWKACPRKALALLPSSKKCRSGRMSDFDLVL